MQALDQQLNLHTINTLLIKHILREVAVKALVKKSILKYYVKMCLFQATCIAHLLLMRWKNTHAIQ